MANEKEFSIELKPDVAKGTYSNLAIITHSRSEFVIDFASMLPGLPKPEVHNRIIMNPEHAKRLFLALQTTSTNTRVSTVRYLSEVRTSPASLWVALAEVLSHKTHGRQAQKDKSIRL